jgi:hypothetical protein
MHVYTVHTYMCTCVHTYVLLESGHDLSTVCVCVCVCVFVCVWVRHAVAQLVAALRYKPEGHDVIGIFHWRILLAKLGSWGRRSLEQKWVPGIFPGGKGGRCLGLTTLPPSCADCLVIMEPSGPVLARTRIFLPSHITSKTEVSVVHSKVGVWFTIFFASIFEIKFAV